MLQLLRLRQINNATFLRLNKATLQMLRIVEPYIVWGFSAILFVIALHFPLVDSPLPTPAPLVLPSPAFNSPVFVNS